MKINKKSLALSASLLLLILASAARADVRVPSVIGDNMVLQQGRKARVWGWAEPGERVTVSFRGEKASATADARGRWEVFVGPHKAGGPFELTVAGRNTLAFRNVLVGEVWVCSGQSNMEWSLANAQDGAQEAAAADYPFIHLFTVTKKTSAEPLDNVEGRWVVTTPKEAAQFSAVGLLLRPRTAQATQRPRRAHTHFMGRHARRGMDEPRRALRRPDAQADTRKVRPAVG